MENLSPLAQTRLFGHHSVLENWQQAFQEGKLHHGLLITGAQGSGKATLAFQFLKWLFRQNVKPQQAATVEKQMMAGSYPGLKIITRLFDEKRQRYAGEITLDAVAPIFEFLRLSLIDGGYRAIVIDGADRMNRNAQNTILKLLEEPPPRTFFLLLVEQPGLMLPTIRSRCMRYTLTPLSQAEFSAGLTALLPEIALQDHAALHALSGGALGEAIRWHEQNWAQLYGEIVQAAMSVLQGQTKPALKWAEAYATPAQETAHDVVRDLLLKRFAAAVTRQNEQLALQPLIPTETDLLAHWRQVDAAGLLRSYGALEQLLRTGERSHLDRKLVLLQALQIFTGGTVTVAPPAAVR